ncbi:phosphatase PAP2-related protein, partial [Bacteroidota bacterium]
FGTGEIYIKDLFFSGHTSTMFLLFLTAGSKNLRMVFLLLTILVAFCVIIQHVHYSIDVIAAPIGAYIGYKGAILLNKYI